MQTPFRVRQAIRSLHYDFNQFTLSDFVRRVETVYRTQISLWRFPLPNPLFGLWILGDHNHHYIFVNAVLHPVQQTHTGLHEIAHIIFQHSHRNVDALIPGEIKSTLNMSDWQGRARTLLARSPHFAAEEREAETFASLVNSKVMQQRRIQRLVESNSSIAELAPLLQTMPFEG